MKTRALFHRALVAIALMLCLLSLQSSAQIPRTLSYQGILTDTIGTPKPDGNYGIAFRLYTVPNGGSALWTETKTLQVKRGLFSTILGDQTSLPSALVFDRQYWLGIQVASEPELSPRIRLAAAGYSLNSVRADTALYARAGGGGGSGRLTLPYADSASSPNAIFFMSNQGTGGGMFGHSKLGPGVFGGSDSTSAVWGVTSGTAVGTSGVFGLATATTGTVNGVYGLSTSSPQGTGVVGLGWLNGVYGFSGNGSAGVVGQSNTTNGVRGISATGVGVRGEVTSVGPGAYGVYGVSPGLIGVFGEVTGGGGGVGVVGNSAAANGIGVRGLATQTTGVTYGVLGVTSSTAFAAAGVRGEASATSGQTIGVEGISTASPIGTGVVGRGAITGGYFEAFDPAGFAGVFNGKVSVSVLQINGGSDLAEPFEVDVDEVVGPGTVMSIDADHPGKLVPCVYAYDTRVAGIVSGASGVKPGLTLRQEDIIEGNMLVAIAGRVYCKAEANSSPIRPGDLLTTSNISGHAMKASDSGKSHGTIIGKAMSGLKEGTGLVLVLVNLQ